MRRLLVLVLILVAAGALTAGWWLPYAEGWVGAKSELLQGLDSLVSLVQAAVALVSLLLAFLIGRGRSRPAETEGVSVEGDLRTDGGDVTGRDKISVPITQEGSSPPTLDAAALEKARQKYLDYIANRHGTLSLKGMGISDRVPLRLGILELYVPLKARPELPAAETWEREGRLAGRELDEEEQAKIAGRLGQPKALLEVLGGQDGLVILGDPGAGKTTFLKYLAVRLARGEGEELGLGQRLPVLAPLSAYANRLSQGRLSIDGFLSEYLQETVSDFPAELLGRALREGNALILLDGLDEVKEARLRQAVVKGVLDFCALHRGAGNRLLLTSRIVGYREARLEAEGLAECTLVDFEDDEIANFVGRWTKALEQQAQGATKVAAVDAGREQQELLEAIRGNPGVRRLAANPLLLTILALMKRQGVTLPERRVELYENYVRTLLSTWNRARGLGRPPVRDLDPVETMRVLAPLALWMHRVNPGAGLVEREAMEDRLEAIYGALHEDEPRAAGLRLLEDVREHAGLLLERGPGQYGFIHLTFEEYLAAAGIALRAQGDARAIVEDLSGHLGDPAWREVVLLTVGYVGIVQRLDAVAGEVLDSLVSERPGEPGQAVVMAGRALLDARQGGVPSATRERIGTALVGTMQYAMVNPRLRREAGLILGWLGWLPEDLDSFIEVPGGKFLYGDDKEECRIPRPYWIGKYPVTNAQYARFMDDDGYARSELWSDAGWEWRERENRTQPGYWRDPEKANAVCPVVGVSWYEAEAYCRWLDAKVRVREAVDSPPIYEGYAVRLPTQEEWERAARGTDGREYPWEGEFDVVCANSRESDDWKYGIGATAVATYPRGVSPAEAWDMSGNVWEWTCSRWPGDQVMHGVRGGSWNYVRRLARCACRVADLPDGWRSSMGFRVVVSVALLDPDPHGLVPGQTPA